jgi:stage II sporulation protein D
MVRRAIGGAAFLVLATAGGASAAFLAAGSSAPSASSTSAPAQTAPTGPVTTVTTSAASTTLVVTGHGYGHGVGMGQWGAYGYALHGWSAADIISHYYPGTTIERDPPVKVRVLLADQAPSVSVGSIAPWRVVDAAGKRLTLPAGTRDLRPRARLRGKKLAFPLTVKPGKAPLEAGVTSYHGNMIVVSNGTTLELVNVVSLESYLDGVVASEVPSSWPPAALEAQAIAARSYAVAQIQSGLTKGPFDLYSDSRSQVYGGIAAETPAANAAVAATTGEIVLYDGKVATTYFSASSGGETMSSADANGVPVPYLVSVPDPYDTLSPYHDWGPLLLSATGAGKVFGLKGALADVTIVTDSSGRVASATIVGTAGRVTLSGPQVQDDLGLRSTWFEFGLLELTPPRGPIAAGAAVTLFGIVHGLSGATLETRGADGVWSTVTRVEPDADGVFSAQVSPRRTTLYRVAAENVRGGQIEVRVRQA